MTQSPTQKKAMWRIMPLLAACLFFNIVDRTNVSIAVLEMGPDIGLSAAAYGLGAGIFFIGYCFFELPSNIALQKFGARLWLFRIMLTWGLVASFTSLAYDTHSFYLSRFLLGAAEAGFFPGMIYYLDQWFDRRIITRLTGLMFVIIPMSFVISLPVSAHLLVLVGWKWLFVIEGIPTVILAFVLLRYLPDRVETSHWLRDDEKAQLLSQRAAGASKIPAGNWKRGLLHPQVSLLAAQYFLLALGGQSLIFWLPKILMSLGLGATQVGWFSAMPYGAAAILTYLWSTHSARRDERYWHSILPCLAAAAAFWAAALTLDTPVLAITFITLAIAFSAVASAAFWAIPRVIIAGPAAAAMIAIITSVGNFSGFVGPYATGAIVEDTGSYQLVLLIAGSTLVAAAIVSSLAGRMAERRPSLLPKVTRRSASSGVNCAAEDAA